MKPLILAGKTELKNIIMDLRKQMQTCKRLQRIKKACGIAELLAMKRLTSRPKATGAVLWAGKRTLIKSTRQNWQTTGLLIIRRRSAHFKKTGAGTIGEWLPINLNLRG